MPFITNKSNITLDSRLETAFSLVPKCDTCADIGCDHGYFGAKLLLLGTCNHLIASDISAPSLQKARNNISKLGLSSNVTFVVANGVEGFSDTISKTLNVICILGMGGITISKILTNGKEKLNNSQLILSAQSDIVLVRKTLQDIGYKLDEECFVVSCNKEYIIMKASPSLHCKTKYTKEELLLGPCFLKTMPLYWLTWLENRKALLSKQKQYIDEASNTKHENQLVEINEELDFIKDAIIKMEQKHKPIERS